MVFEYTDRRGKRHSKSVPPKYARAKAIELAEDVLVDKISNVTYTVTLEDGTTETKELDYYNDIL